MIKRISVFLCIMLVMSLFMPVLSYAADDKGLEKAITAAKSKLDIPASYTFTYDVSAYDGTKTWSLNWNSKSGTSDSINVQVDDKGRITNYSHYKYSDYSKRKLPKVSRSEALSKAQAFIKKMDPGIASQIKNMDNSQAPTMDSSYYFSFARMVKGIPFYNNTVYVAVNNDDGSIQSYSCNWTDDAAFPDASKAITAADAQKAYKDKLGIELVYKYAYDNDKLKIYAVYAPVWGNDAYAVDALTGEKVQTGYSYYGYGKGGNEMVMYDSAKTKEAKADVVTLTPEEIKAVEEASKLLNQDDAEKAARAFKPLQLTADFKLTGAYLSRSWPARDQYNWSLTFTKSVDGKTGESSYVSATLDAVTGEITNFYNNVSYKEGDKAKYDQAAAKAATEAFLKEYFPDKYAQVQFNDRDDRSIIVPMDAQTPAPTSYNISYVRMVNGVRFPDNSLNVGYDAVNGTISSYSMTWFKNDFPSVSKVIPLDQAYGKFFTDLGLELQYKTKYQDDSESKRVVGQPVKQEIRLVYALKSEKPAQIDANSGAVLNYDGSAYKEYKPIQYSDIKGNAAEKKIQVLADYGIAPEGTKFRPEDGITQKDFLTMLSKTMNSYYGPVITVTSGKTDVDSFYDQMIQQGIIKVSEKAPDAVLKREDGIKFIIRALKYDKVAEIQGIFKSAFKDTKDATPQLAGYITIAQGLGIAEGANGYFKPKSQLTRAGAAVMIYNYLQQ